MAGDDLTSGMFKQPPTKRSAAQMARIGDDLTASTKEAVATAFIQAINDNIEYSGVKFEDTLKVSLDQGLRAELAAMLNFDAESGEFANHTNAQLASALTASRNIHNSEWSSDKLSSEDHTMAKKVADAAYDAATQALAKATNKSVSVPSH